LFAEWQFHSYYIPTFIFQMRSRRQRRLSRLLLLSVQA
jgi:hypothetical protein